MLSGVQQGSVEQSHHNMAVWKLFQAVFDAMWDAFQESNKTLEDYAHIAGVPQSGDMSGQLATKRVRSLVATV